MKQNLLKDTCAYQFGVRPAVLQCDMSGVHLKDVMVSVNKMMSASDLYTAHLTADDSGEWDGVTGIHGEQVLGLPERDAIVFYLMNHAVSIVRQGLHPYESLGDHLPLVEEYHRQLGFRSARMFFYLLLICTRESRHEHGGSGMGALYTKYGMAISNFHKMCLGVSESQAVDYLKKNPPATTIGKYTEFLAEQFYKGNYSSSYGGKAWGKVADVLRDFVHGKLTAEMMLDTAFTLCHNNGPIFNKGMLYANYTGGGQDLYKILDVQRSGQIPQLVANKESKYSIDPVVQGLWKMCLARLGKPMEGYVDWFAVKDLGALHSWTSEQLAQQAKYGLPANQKAKKKAIVVDYVDSDAAKDKMKYVKSSGKLEIMPGVYVTLSKVRPK